MVLPTVWFVLKISVFLFVYMLIRATIPRIRYDQLMRFGWKVLLPLALANILVTSFLVALYDPTALLLFAAVALGPPSTFWCRSTFFTARFL